MDGTHYAKLAARYAERFLEENGELWAHEEVARALQEALENDNPYKTSLDKVVRKTLEVLEGMKELCAFAAQHEIAYSGPHFSAELEEAKKLLGITK